LENSFGEQPALHGSFENSSLDEPQLCGAALGTSFKNTALGSSFRQQLWEQLLGAALENSFGEPLWGTALKHSRFEATVLQRYCGVQLWVAASGNRFGEQLCGAALTTLQNNCFEEQQLSGAAFRSSFQGQLYRQLRRAAFGSNFGAQFWEV